MGRTGPFKQKKGYLHLVPGNPRRVTPRVATLAQTWHPPYEGRCRQRSPGCSDSSPCPPSGHGEPFCSPPLPQQRSRPPECGDGTQPQPTSPSCVADASSPPAPPLLTTREQRERRPCWGGPDLPAALTHRPRGRDSRDAVQPGRAPRATSGDWAFIASGF